MKNAAPKQQENVSSMKSWKDLPTVSKMQMILVNEALRRCKNNRTQAARMLGINRKTVVRILQRQLETSKALPLN